MTETQKNQNPNNLPPGVCVPWEQKVAEAAGPIAGNPDILKKEWEQLDAFAYIYLRSWVHR